MNLKLPFHLKTKKPRQAPETAGAVQDGMAETEASEAALSEAKLSGAQPSEAKPAGVKPAVVKPAIVKPAMPKPEGSRLNTVQTGEIKPVRPGKDGYLPKPKPAKREKQRPSGEPGDSPPRAAFIQRIRGRWRQRRGSILLPAANAALLILFLVCLGRWGHFSNLLLSQQAAERWAGESGERFAQVSCFLPADSGLSPEKILEFRQKLDGKYLEISLEAPEGRRLYQDAWCAFGELSVSGAYGNATAQAVGVGGDYFFFHPLQLRSGSYIREGDLMQDRVVLDEELAWRLYGSADLAGLTVTINNKPYVIAGVVSREDDRLSKRIAGELPMIYLDFSEMAALTESGVACYELAGPDPISGFVYGAVKDLFPVGAGEILENSARYGLEAMIKTLWHFSDRTLRTTGVAYPYFENAARLAENRMCLLLVFMALLLVCPLVCLIWLIVRGWRKLKAFIRSKRVNYEDL